MIIAKTPSCRTIRAWLQVDHDDRLSRRRQAATEAHLDHCAGCRQFGDDLARLGHALRQEAAEHRPDDAELTRISPEVLVRMAAEQDTSWSRRLRDVVAERHRLWFMAGSVGATMAAVLLVAVALSLGLSTQPGSLASLLQTYDYLGSNTNPVWQPIGISLPHVAPNTRTAAILIQPFPPLELKHLALSAVVTQEGSLSSLEVLQDDTPDAELTRAISRLASDVRFVPARARGRAVAMNVIWILERTTVAPPVGGA